MQLAQDVGIFNPDAGESFIRLMRSSADITSSCTGSRADRHRANRCHFRALDDLRPLN